MTLAIAFVVGHQFGPQLSARRPSTPVVCSVEQKASDDTFKAGERLEPRVPKAPLLHRLSAVRPSYGFGTVPYTGESLAEGAVDSDGTSDSGHLPNVKHVPRMERGDPPRA
jgi:hypothetical protein